MAIQGAKDIIEDILVKTKTYFNPDTVVLGVTINLYMKQTNVANISLKTAM